jgi:CRP/FNR family nitrogen fixation transcriptional regulator
LCRYRLLPGRHKSILQFLLPGDSFGFEVGRYHLDTVKALIPTKVLAAGREALMDAAASIRARLSKALLASAVRALVAAEEQSIVLRAASSTERLALFLLDMDARLHARSICR